VLTSSILNFYRHRTRAFGKAFGSHCVANGGLTTGCLIKPQDLILDPEAYPSEPSIIGSLIGGAEATSEDKTKDS